MTGPGPRPPGPARWRVRHYDRAPSPTGLQVLTESLRVRVRLTRAAAPATAPPPAPAARHGVRHDGPVTPAAAHWQAPAGPGGGRHSGCSGPGRDKADSERRTVTTLGPSRSRPRHPAGPAGPGPPGRLSRLGARRAQSRLSSRPGELSSSEARDLPVTELPEHRRCCVSGPARHGRSSMDIEMWKSIHYLAPGSALASESRVTPGRLGIMIIRVVVVAAAAASGRACPGPARPGQGPGSCDEPGTRRPT